MKFSIGDIAYIVHSVDDRITRLEIEVIKISKGGVKYEAAGFGDLFKEENLFATFDEAKTYLIKRINEDYNRRLNKCEKIKESTF